MAGGTGTFTNVSPSTLTVHLKDLPQLHAAAHWSRKSTQPAFRCQCSALRRHSESAGSKMVVMGESCTAVRQPRAYPLPIAICCRCLAVVIDRTCCLVGV